MIPKVIHYCWFGKKKMPELNIKCIESWKKYCPDYKIIEWNEDNYDISSNTYMQEAYEKKMWAFVSDVARLDIIYRYGGIYLDTDVEVVRNMDDLLYQDGFLGTFSNGVIATGLGFGAVQGNGLIKEFLDDYEHHKFDIKNGTETMKLCVDYQTELLEKKGYTREKGFQTIDGISIYPEDILTNIRPYTRSKIVYPHSYTIHLSAASWRDKENTENQAEMFNLLKEMKTSNSSQLYWGYQKEDKE